MKKFIRCLMVSLIVPIAVLCSGCVNENKELFSNKEVVSIKDISKTNSAGLVDTYTITYTNGKTDTFTIVNGEDGEDGENLYTNITINDLYNEIKPTKEDGYSLVDFIDEYLDIKVDTTAVASSKALRSAVSIFVEHKIQIVDYNTITGYNPYTGNTYGVTDSISWGAGSGVIYNLDTTTGDAYIITNYHVCYNKDAQASDGIATRFTLYVYGGETLSTNLQDLSNYNSNNSNTEYSSKLEFDQNGLPIINYGYGAIDAEYVGGSEQYDIAVLKVTGSEILKNSDYLATEVYNSDLVTVGNTAIAIGNPGAGGISVTKGVVSIDSTYAKLEIKDSQNPVTLREFRIDTAVNSGNSGGGLFDGYGRLIGIVNAKYSGTAYDDINYAIPSNIAVRVADIIIDTCNGVDRVPKRVIVGVSVGTSYSQGYYDEDEGVMRIKETIYVASINPNSLASTIGLEVGDIITSIDIIKNSTTITLDLNRRYQMIDAMLYAREGDQIKFIYTRNGVEQSATTSVLTSDNFIDIA